MLSRNAAPRALASGLLCLRLLVSRAAATTAFTTGNLVVYRVGDGSGAIASTGNKVFLDEYTPAGNLVRSIELPSTNNGSANLIAGDKDREGLLTRSNDGRYLVFAGYNSTIPASGALNNLTSVQRVIGRIDRSGNLDLSTIYAGADAAQDPRGVASDNGTNL